MTRVYLDHAATSPLTVSAVEAMNDVGSAASGNPSSVHVDGQRARARLEDARSELAAALGVEDDEVVFCATGTEADNLALRGIAWAAPGPRPHVVTSAIEHDAVRRTARWLDEKGQAEVTVVPAEGDGTVDAARVVEALRDDTALVSLMALNNESGVVQAVEEVGAACRQRGVTFHVDAAQAPGRLPFRPWAVPCDLATLSAHKAGGPKGVGVLVVRRGLKLQPIVTGGAQEGGLRAGTESVTTIAGASRALVDALEETDRRAPAMRRLTQHLERGLAALSSDAAPVVIHGAGAVRAPGFTLASFGELDATAVLQALDLAGFAVSTGSACASGSTAPSHVLAAMGVRPAVARAALRFSLGPTTREGDVDALLAVLPAVLSTCRVPAAS